MKAKGKSDLFIQTDVQRDNVRNMEQVGNKDQLKSIKTNNDKTTKAYQNKTENHRLTKKQEPNTFNLGP